MKSIPENEQKNIINDALRFIPADDRDIWVTVGMAVKSELGETGLDLWDTWSQTSESYKTSDAQAVWRGISTNGGIGIGTLFHLAQQNGWQGNGEKPDPAAVEKRKREAERRAAKEQAEQQRKRENAAGTALTLWQTAQPASKGNPYLQRKQVAPVVTLREIDADQAAEIIGYTPKSSGEPLTGRLLVVPVKVDGQLSTVELIDGSGHKAALAGGAKSGGYWATQQLPDTLDILQIGEGVATALSAHEATGYPAVAALSCGNLEKVAKIIRQRYPSAKLVILADIGNGQPKAEDAARAVNGLLAIPEFGDDAPDGLSDFNDMAVMLGLDAVRDAIAKAEAPTDKAKKQKPLESKFKVLKRGVVYFDGEGEEPKWICSPLYVTAYTRNDNGEAWGRLLEFKDPGGQSHQWAMPMRLLSADGAEYRSTLLDMGLQIAPGRKPRELLTQYIQTAKPAAWARCVEQTGWHRGCFVLPDAVIGAPDKNERVLLQTTGMVITPSANGTLEDWQREVAALCVGNSRLVLAVSTAFAAALLEPLGEENGGIHFRGTSSTGKTTCLLAAVSVNGGHTNLSRWRATINGLEAVAASHNDALLVLDELGQVEAKEAGETAYMLANGSGKQRANKYGGARHKQQWRLLFLSSGELSLADHMNSAGKRSRAGQETRLVDIPVDTGQHGAFEVLHGYPSGAEFSRHLTARVRQYHGTAARAFLEQLVAIPAEALIKQCRELQQDFIKECLPDDASGQAVRVANRFALIACGGELATALDITGWPEGEAIRAAQRCFSDWLNSRGGTGDHEARAALQQVRLFFELHGESRFTPWQCERCNGTGYTHNAECRDCNGTGHPVTKTINRVGFRRNNENGTEFYVLPEAFKAEICKGLDARFVTRLLVQRGWIVPGSDRAVSVHKLPGSGKPKRVYHFSSMVMG